MQILPLLLPTGKISGAALGITILLCMQRQSGDVEVAVNMLTAGVCAGKQANAVYSELSNDPKFIEF